jgi:hypothetical protein
MIFENNWAYPFKYAMFDPVLKIRLMRDIGRSDGASIRVNYDPEIVAGQYGMLPKGLRRENLLADPTRHHLLIVPEPCVSDRSTEIVHFSCGGTRVGDVFRFKVHVPDDVQSATRYKNRILQQKIPFIQDHPLEFLMYVVKNWINFPEFEE